MLPTSEYQKDQSQGNLTQAQKKEPHVVNMNYYHKNSGNILWKRYIFYSFYDIVLFFGLLT